jgi:hypothetical protein
MIADLMYGRKNRCDDHGVGAYLSPGGGEPLGIGEIGICVIRPLSSEGNLEHAFAERLGNVIESEFGHRGVQRFRLERGDDLEFFVGAEFVDRRHYPLKRVLSGREIGPHVKGCHFSSLNHVMQ